MSLNLNFYQPFVNILGRRLALAVSVITLTLACAAAADARPVSLAWDANADSVTAGYYVYYGPSAGDRAVGVDVGTSTTHQFDLIPGLTYYFSVRAYNGSAQLGEPSSEVTITLPNRAPVLINPGEVVVQGGVVSTQLVASDPDDDRLTYMATGLPSGASVDSATGIIAGMLETGTYSVTATASDGDLQSRESFSVRVIGGGACSAPSAPVLRTPGVSGNSISLSWAASSGIGLRSYLLVAGSVSGQTDLAVHDTGSTATTLAAEAPSGPYFVRVAARNSCGQSAFSNEVNVTLGAQTSMLPGVPVDVDAQVTPGNVTLQWSPPVTGDAPSGYLIEVGSAPGLANLGSVRVAAQETSVSRASPQGGRYYVRVRAFNAAGNGPIAAEIVVDAH